MTEHVMTAGERVEEALQIIEDRDSTCHAFITVDGEGARQQAKEIDDKRDKYHGPLAGVPIAVKDNICTKNLTTTCGSKMLEHFVPTQDAFVISRLREAGAVIIGKTNMDEFAMGSTTETSYFGATCNPWDTTRSPGGSSGGSAAAVASGMVSAALGSDTGGSIRLPAAHCGIVGLKPTYGSVSRNGLVAYASSFDQIGPMGRSVEDVAALYDVIAGYDPMDTTSNIERQGKSNSLLESLQGNIRGWRIGVPREFMSQDVSREVRQAIEESAEFFHQQGAQVVPMELSLPREMVEAYYIIACAQASSNLARFDGVRYGFRAKDYKNLEELYCKSRGQGMGLECKKRIMMGTFVLSAGYYQAYYKKAIALQRQVQECFAKAFHEYDLLLSPVSGNVAPRLTDCCTNPVSMYQEDMHTIGANLTGLPAISIPYQGQGETNQLPIGIQLMAGANQEQKLLNAAYCYQQNCK